MKHLLLGLFALLLVAVPVRAQPAPFTAVQAGAAPAPIVVQYDPVTKTGADYERLNKLHWARLVNDKEQPWHTTANYLREAISRMTGQTPEILSSNDLTRGLVLTTLQGASAEIKQDPAIQKALASDGSDSYNHIEAYFVRSEPRRTLIVGNTPWGVMSGVVELLESVDYEVLGMGPRWTHVPDFRQKPLVFNLLRSGRPGFYHRKLTATSGQSYGVGTIYRVPLADAADETVETSYSRWLMGTRMAGASMPPFPGHAMQSHHRAVVAAMLESKSSDGFLVPRSSMGLDNERPPAGEENKGHLWLNTDPAGEPKGKVFLSDGKEWKPQNLLSLQANLDLSVPLVRQTILEHLKKTSETRFKDNPDDMVVYGTDPEDGGGYSDLANLLKYPNWYPQYLQQEKLPFGRPYVLHGFKGLQQPRELWDPTAASDIVFGFNNWLLREYDKWIDSRPAADRVTSTGKSKKDQLRLSLYSYNFHDVPPNFNLDPRIRVMIASYPKHRGYGKWKNYKTQKDMAQVFRVMLPREPAGDYWIISLAYFRDFSPHGISGSESPSAIHRKIKDQYEAGFRALSVETDFNFGKLGLAYYLYAHALWNPHATVQQLEARRDRWLQRSFGSGWRQMKQYYDFMAPDNFLINAPNNWARAIRFIEAADQEIDAVREPAAQGRLDDVKQFWYFYYLIDTGQAVKDNVAFREFVWKGQMSYQNAMHTLTRRAFSTNSPAAAAGEAFNKGRAHYTAEETAEWWAKILEHWKITPVDSFAEVRLADGTAGKMVDLNDLVMVREFQGGTFDVPLIYNAGYQKQPTIYAIARRAGDEIGMQMYWPFDANNRFYMAKEVPYGIERWDAEDRQWIPLVDKTMIVQPSRPLSIKDRPYQLVTVRYKAPAAGTYRLEPGLGGNASKLGSLALDPLTDQYQAASGHTYRGQLEGLTQSPIYLYIPKDTRSLDLEVYDTYKGKWLKLHTGLPTTGLKQTRQLDITRRGTHRITLQPGEDGSLAIIGGNGFAPPYLYSIPDLFAKGAPALLVPRAIARADGLTIME